MVSVSVQFHLGNIVALLTFFNSIFLNETERFHSYLNFVIYFKLNKCRCIILYAF